MFWSPWNVEWVYFHPENVNKTSSSLKIKWAKILGVFGKTDKPFLGTFLDKAMQFEQVFFFSNLPKWLSTHFSSVLVRKKNAIIYHNKCYFNRNRTFGIKNFETLGNIKISNIIWLPTTSNTFFYENKLFRTTTL